MTYFDKKVTLADSFSAGKLRERKKSSIILGRLSSKIERINVAAFGLLLLGFGFAILLSPFSPNGSADNGWRNPSLIATIIVAGRLF